MYVWAGGIDALASTQAERVGIRLFERLKPCIGDADRWESLPEEIEVFRAGEPDGPCWTLNREIADGLARQHDLSSIHEGRVRRSEVAAFITHRGEDEVVVRPERVRVVASSSVPHPRRE